MNADECLELAEQYAPRVRQILRGMAARSVADEDLIAVLWWGVHLIAIQLLDTDEARALRQWLDEVRPPEVPPPPSRSSRCIQQTGPYVPILWELWKLVRLEQADLGNEEVGDVLLVALRVAETDRALTLLGLQ